MFFVPAMYLVTSLIPLFLWMVCCKFVRQPFMTKDRFLNYIQWTINSWLSFLVIQGYIAFSSWTLAYYSCDSYGQLLTNYPSGDENRVSRHLWNTDKICSASSGQFAGLLIFFWVGLGVYVLGVPIAGLIAWYVIVNLSRWRARKRLVLRKKENDEDAEKVYGELGLSPTDGDSKPKIPQASPVSPDVASEDQAEKSRIERLAQELKNSTTSLLVEGRYAQEPVVVGIEAHSGAIRTFGVLYHRYRPRRFWWELIVVIRKLLIVICFAYLEQQPIVAVVMSSFVILTALILQLYFQPYRKHTSNILEALLLLIQYIMLILGLMFYASQDYDGIPLVGYSSAVTTSVVIFITVGICIGVFFLVLETLYEFRSNLYVPIREKMKEKAFLNRAEHALKVLRKKNKGDIMVDEEGNEVDTVNHHGDYIHDEVIIEDDGMSAVVPASEVIIGDTQYASALFDYVPQNDDELALKAGDRVQVIEKLDDGWWRARVEGTNQEGLVPGNYMRQ
jgi:hypothetical protein